MMYYCNVVLLYIINMMVYYSHVMLLYMIVHIINTNLCIELTGAPSSQFVSLLDKLHQQHQHQPTPIKMGCDEARVSPPSSADSWPELMSPSMLAEKKAQVSSSSNNNSSKSLA